jgi:hypothetical protein
MALDLGVATGQEMRTPRWSEFDGGVTFGVAYEGRWVSLKSGLSMRYFSPRNDDQNPLSGMGDCGSGYGCAAVIMAVYGAVVGEAVFHAPLGDGWMLGVPVQARLAWWVPGAVELGGGIAFGKHF